MFLKVKYNSAVNFFKIPNPESEEFSANEVIISIVEQLNITTECAIIFKDRDGAEICVSQPTIVAVGPDKSTIGQYFITIDGKKIAVPIHFKFNQVFDLYFKTFYIFNIQFDATLANFLGFIAKFIYKIDDKKKASSRLLEVQTMFENKLKLLQSN